MGGKTKGERRVTSMSTALSMTKPLATGIIKSGAVRVAVGIGIAAMPQHAAAIYGAYKAYQFGSAAVKAYREYKQLREDVSKRRAARLESERVAFREGTERALDREIDPEMERRVSTRLAILFARPELQAAADAALGHKADEDTKQRFAMMMQATATQFLMGAAQGGRSHLIDRTAELLFR